MSIPTFFKMGAAGDKRSPIVDEAFAPGWTIGDESVDQFHQPIDVKMRTVGRESEEFHKIVHGAGSTGWPQGDPWNYHWQKFLVLDGVERTALEIQQFKNEMIEIIRNRAQTADQIKWTSPKP